MPHGQGENNSFSSTDSGHNLHQRDFGIVDPVPEEVVQPQQPPDYILDDDHSGEVGREYSGVFEGPEKTLEVMFRKRQTHTPEEPRVDEKVGLRHLTRLDLDRICARARCTILSSVHNQYLDAYVLSESSLFIYPYMLVLKTCGTTTLLRCIALLIELGKRVGLEIDWVGYSRKNFNFPGDQQYPHESFHQEMEYLYSHRNLCERLDGNGYTLGPVTSDHWFVFVADHTIRALNLDIDSDRVLNIMMFDIDEDVAKNFFYEAYDKLEGETKEEETKRISKLQTTVSGIDALCPGAIFDPRAFEPCGYSMNAILFRSYYTIHITPETGSSYCSFETNQRVKSYRPLINNVLGTFRPKRFVLTLMADEAGLDQMKENPIKCPASDAKFVVPAGTKKKLLYKRSECASINVEDDTCCMMGNWVVQKDAANQQPASIRADKHRGMSVS